MTTKIKTKNFQKKKKKKYFRSKILNQELYIYHKLFLQPSILITV